MRVPFPQQFQSVSWLNCLRLSWVTCLLMDQSLWPQDEICLQTQSRSCAHLWNLGWAGSNCATNLIQEKSLIFHRQKLRTNAKQTKAADENHEQLSLLLWVEIFQTQEVSKLLIWLNGKGQTKKGKKAVSGQGVQAAQYFIKGKFNNYSSESWSFQLISTAYPLGLSLLSPNR